MNAPSRRPGYRSYVFLVLLVAVTALITVVAACAERSATSPEDAGIRAAKPGGSGGGDADPVVQSVVPDSATQDTTLDIEVSGKNFDEGSVVELGQGGTPSAKIQTNSTTFLNPRKLRANITVAADADLGLYDVIVTTFRGRRGIGAEMFEVQQAGHTGSGNDFPVTITLGNGGGITYDDGGPVYENGVDGNLRIRGDGILFWNLDTSRSFRLNFGSSDLPFPNPGDTRVGALQLSAEDNEALGGNHLFGMGENDPRDAILRTRVESTDGVIYQLRFQFPVLEDLGDPINAEIAAESDFLVITRTGDTWTIATAGSPRDRAMVFSKTGRGKKTPRINEGSFHMPFVMTITCNEDCPGP